MPRGQWEIILTHVLLKSEKEIKEENDGSIKFVPTKYS